MRDGTVDNNAVVTPSDTKDLDTPGIGLWVGVTGDVKITNPKGHTFILPNVTAGMWHTQQTTRIWATDTAATGIVVGW